MDSIKHWKPVAVGVIGVVAICMSQAAYGAPATDPCSLLTQAQVSTTLGVNVGAGKRIAPTLCQWTAPGQSGLHAKRVIITLHDPREFEYLKMPVGNGTTKTPVSGIGDEAVSGTTPKVATTLSVKKGSVVFVVNVGGFPEEQTKAMEKTLALEILSKL